MNARKDLAEAATCFLASLPPQERERYQQEVNKFVRWYGRERHMDELSAHEVASYAERMEGSSANASKRLEPARAFLLYAKKEGLTRNNLAVHLRLKKGSLKQALLSKGNAQAVTLTPEGYRELKAELDALEDERPRIAEEIRRAAADKDFHENAPLDAIKDHQGMVEARIRELRAILTSAVVGTERVATARVTLGSTVVLHELSTGEKLGCTLVNPSEASLTRGKLSIASPTGKALLGKDLGEEIEVEAPAGTLRYRIDRIES